MKDIVIRIRPAGAGAMNFAMARAWLAAKVLRFNAVRITPGEGRKVFPIIRRGRIIAEVEISFEDPPNGN